VRREGNLQKNLFRLTPYDSRPTPHDILAVGKNEPVISTRWMGFLGTREGTPAESKANQKRRKGM